MWRGKEDMDGKGIGVRRSEALGLGIISDREFECITLFAQESNVHILDVP